MIFILLIVLLLLFLAIPTFAGVADMSTIASVYDQWWDLADNWAQIRGNLTKEEILAIIVNESSGNPQAFNPGDPSYGLMGVSLPIGKAYGSVSSFIDLYTPTKNIESGSGFLSDLKRKWSAAYPLNGQNGWVQMYNEGETSFLNGHRAQGYEQAYLDHLNKLQQYDAQKQNS